MISHNEVDGWFDSSSEHVYRTAIDKFPSESHFVEIGAYLGRSAIFMAQEMKRQNKKIYFDVIDHFKGSPEHQETLQDKNLYHMFLKNVKDAEVIRDISIFVLSSLEAVKFYDDNSLDFVFIDAEHSYESVIQDIQAWLPKIKKGGILAGDDYLKVHPGVIKAVDEIFGENKRIYKRIWLYDKI